LFQGPGCFVSRDTRSSAFSAYGCQGHVLLCAPPPGSVQKIYDNPILVLDLFYIPQLVSGSWLLSLRRYRVISVFHVWLPGPCAALSSSTWLCAEELELHNFSPEFTLNLTTCFRVLAAFAPEIPGHQCFPRMAARAMCCSVLLHLALCKKFKIAQF
jgi:hypothetical protein